MQMGSEKKGCFACRQRGRRGGGGGGGSRMEVWLPVVVVTRDPESRSQLEEETLALEAEVTCAHNTATVALDPGSIVNKNVRMN